LEKEGLEPSALDVSDQHPIMATPLDVNHALALLKQEYDVALPEPRDAFELIVWENCAYLVDDETRTRTYRQMLENIGVAPTELLDAGVKRIEKAIAGGGMKPAHRAAKVLRCAEIAEQFARGDLTAQLRALTEKPRRTLLKRFPGIADPGADKVLLLCGLAASPALDSNGLRVLERWGVVKAGLAYAAGYRAGVSALSKAGITGGSAVEAFALLRAHGRELCKRSAPLCGPCPLRAECPSSTQRG